MLVQSHLVILHTGKLLEYLNDFMRTLKNIILQLVILPVAILYARAATVNFELTNSLGQPDNTPILLQPIASYINADGSIQTTGLPFWIYPTNGVISTNLMMGNWLATNSTIVSQYTGPGQPATSQGLIFGVPSGSGSYSIGQLAISGYNVYNYNGLAFTLSASNIFSSIGYTPLTPQQVTNLFALSNTNIYLPGTNIFLMTSNGSVIWQVPTPWFITNGLASSANLANLATTNFAASVTNNFGNIVYSNSSAYLTPSDGTNLAYSSATNQGAASTNFTMSVSNLLFADSLVIINLSSNALESVIGASNTVQAANILTTSNNLSSAKQSTNAVLSNLIATGAETNQIQAGTNMIATTNMITFVITLHATNQVFLTNGLVQWTGLVPSSFLLTNILPGLTNGFITSSALAGLLSTNTAAITYYPTSNPSGFISSSATNTLAGWVSANFYLDSNPSNYITSSALSPYWNSNQVASAIQSSNANYITFSILASSNQLILSQVTNLTQWATNGLAVYVRSYADTNGAGQAAIFSALNTATNSFDTNGAASYVNSQLSAIVVTNNQPTVTFGAINPRSGTLSINAGAGSITAGTFNGGGFIGSGSSLTGITSNGIVSVNQSQIYPAIVLPTIPATNIFQVITNAQAQLSFGFGTKTNFVMTTNVIGLDGLYGGTYLGVPFGSVWTNVYNPLWTIQQSGSFLYFYTSSIALYQSANAQSWTTLPGAPSPAPTGNYGSKWHMNGVVMEGFPYYTNLISQIQLYVSTNGGSGGTNGTTNFILSGVVSSWTTNNIFSASGTNAIDAEIARLASNPTNGITTNSFFVLMQGVTNIFASTNWVVSYVNGVTNQVTSQYVIYVNAATNNLVGGNYTNGVNGFTTLGTLTNYVAANGGGSGGGANTNLSNISTAGTNVILSLVTGGSATNALPLINGLGTNENFFGTTTLGGSNMWVANTTTASGTYLPYSTNLSWSGITVKWTNSAGGIVIASSTGNPIQSYYAYQAIDLTCVNGMVTGANWNPTNAIDSAEYISPTAFTLNAIAYSFNQQGGSSGSTVTYYVSADGVNWKYATSVVFSNTQPVVGTNSFSPIGGSYVLTVVTNNSPGNEWFNCRLFGTASIAGLNIISNTPPLEIIDSNSIDFETPALTWNSQTLGASLSTDTNFTTIIQQTIQNYYGTGSNELFLGTNQISGTYFFASNGASTTLGVTVSGSTNTSLNGNYLWATNNHTYATNVNGMIYASGSVVSNALGGWYYLNLTNLTLPGYGTTGRSWYDSYFPIGKDWQAAGINQIQDAKNVLVTYYSQSTANAQVSINTNSAGAYNLEVFGNANVDGSLTVNGSPINMPISVVTNGNAWYLFTNLTAYHSGRWYSFSNSVSAGINEIEALQQYNTNGGGGIKIVIGDNSPYYFQGQITLSNSTEIIGDGYWSSGFIYNGPTNLFTTTNIMAEVARTGAANSTNLSTVGLIQLQQAPIIINGIQLCWNYHFEGFYVKVATNFPCVLIAGSAVNLYEYRLGLMSAGGLTTNTIGGALVPLQSLPAKNSVIAQAVYVYQPYTIRDSYELGCAAGFLNVGNSYFKADNTMIFQTAYSSSGYGNLYPSTNWLSVGSAIYVSSATFQAKVEDCYPYQNKCSIWSDCSTPLVVNGYNPQQSMVDLAVGSGGLINVDDSEISIPFNNIFGGVDTIGGNWIATNIMYMSTNDANFTVNGGSVQYSYRYGTGLTEYINGVEQFGWAGIDNISTNFNGAGYFALAGPMILRANISGATNANATTVFGSGVVPTNNLPSNLAGVALNNGGGLTNLNVSEFISAGVSGNNLSAMTTNYSAFGTGGLVNTVMQGRGNDFSKMPFNGVLTNIYFYATTQNTSINSNAVVGVAKNFTPLVWNTFASIVNNTGNWATNVSGSFAFSAGDILQVFFGNPTNGTYSPTYVGAVSCEMLRTR